MRRYFLDASALSKRYVAEAGSDKVVRLMDSLAADRFICVTLGVGEVLATINRRVNEHRLTRSAGDKAFSDVAHEVLQNADILKLPMPDEVVVPGFAYIRKHNLNTTDAVILHAALKIQDTLPRKDSLVVVAADERLVRAARAEGLETLDPVHDSDEHLDALLYEPPPAPLAL